MALIDEIGNVFEQEIELIQNKFDNKRNKRQILKWLNNFDENDQIYALDMLQQFRFVSEDEVKEKANRIMQGIKDASDQDSYIYMLPIGKYGKSSSLLAYYLKKTTAFEALEYSQQIQFIEHDAMLDEILFHSNDKLIYFDDFFGTGFSFIKEIRKLRAHSNISLQRAIKNIEAWGLFYMDICHTNLKINGVIATINAEKHYPIFGLSPLFFENEMITINYKEIANKNADKRDLFKAGLNRHNLGYKNCQGFISFAHTTPNNTLPIIWSDKSKWFPIFGTNPDLAFNLLKEKKQAIMKLALENHFHIKFEEAFKVNFQLTNFLVFGILFFLSKKWAEPRIVSNLGIDTNTFEYLIMILKSKKYIDIQYKITKKGHFFVDKINKEIEKHREIKRKTTILPTDYIPKSFSG